ncbi:MULTISPECIES: 5'/3'-nucleotidase SurE [Oceanotoga]|uniref:5'/3'-nucleotidase SurE n=1 Tax=Oceanotoga TaxID=1255275 RepID=UPI002713A5F8|nr:MULTISPECIES: 5'/3'-nucleotidase SurE [Oceanotoga]MDO7976055.1 5'/3'-nucleotidase SurE [Oceanotoga teriensis]
MNILLTNDDGIKSEGIKILAEKISKYHDIYICAPEKENTGMSGALTFSDSIKIKKFSLNCGEKDSYYVTGTPADSVIMGLDHVYKNIKFDIVLSGINDEPNIGDDIRYSGTVGAAFEAAFSGYPAIALSLEYGNTKYYNSIINVLIKILNKKHIPKGTILNINSPNKPDYQIKGEKYVKLGRRRYSNRIRQKNKDEYIIYGDLIEEKNDSNTDNYYIQKDYITITPLKIDNTDYNFLKNNK